MEALVGPERDALHAFCKAVRARFGERVRQLALFGSRARGQATTESDIDVLVVVDSLTGTEGREIAYLAGDILTAFDVLLSPFALSAERMTELCDGERLIAREIARDAVPL